MKIDNIILIPRARNLIALPEKPRTARDVVASFTGPVEVDDLVPDGTFRGQKPAPCGWSLAVWNRNANAVSGSISF